MYKIKLKSNHGAGTLVNRSAENKSILPVGAPKHRCSEDQSQDAAREDERCKHQSNKAHVQLKFDTVDGESEVYDVGYTSN